MGDFRRWVYFQFFGGILTRAGINHRVTGLRTRLSFQYCFRMMIRASISHTVPGLHAWVSFLVRSPRHDSHEYPSHIDWFVIDSLRLVPKKSMLEMFV